MGWLSAWPSDEVSKVRFFEKLFSVVYIDDNNKMNIVGSAFTISIVDSKALCLSAAHVFEEIYRLAYGKSNSNLSHIPIEGNEPLFDITDLIEKKKVKVLAIIKGKPYMCDIVSTSIQPPLDTALIIVDPPDNPNVAFTVIHGLNSDPLSVGAEIVLTAYSKQKKAQVSDEAYLVLRDPSIRFGKILSYDPQGGALIKAPIYTTNIPCDPGMSGAPVFLYDKKTKLPSTAIGVISSDMSKPEAFGCNTIDGHSYISPIWTTAVHNLRDQDDNLVTLKELAGKGFIKDFGSALDRVSIDVMPGGLWKLELT